EIFAKTDKPLMVYVSPSAPGIMKKLNTAGVPAFDAPEGCAAALAALAMPEHPASPADAEPSVAMPEIGAPGGSLDEHEAKQLFARFGVTPAREAIAANPQEATAVASEIGQGAPVVIKLLSRDVTHKTEIGGVRVGVAPDD